MWVGGRILIWVGKRGSLLGLVAHVVGEGRGFLDSGHMGTPCEQTDITENITFPQTTYVDGNEKSVDFDDILESAGRTVIMRITF